VQFCPLAQVAVESFFLSCTHVVDFLEDRQRFGVQHLLHLRFEKVVALARYLDVVSGKKFLY